MIKKLKKGTILFQGDCRKHIDDVFRMVGQRGKEDAIIEGEYVSFFTFSEKIAQTYGSCRGNGFVHRFEVLNDLKLEILNYNENPDILETEDISKEICVKGVDGLYIDYGREEKDNEIAICSPEKKLIHRKYRKCSDPFFNESVHDSSRCSQECTKEQCKFYGTYKHEGKMYCKKHYDIKIHK